jgi:hypothetical protein
MTVNPYLSQYEKLIQNQPFNFFVSSHIHLTSKDNPQSRVTLVNGEKPFLSIFSTCAVYGS